MHQSSYLGYNFVSGHLIQPAVLNNSNFPQLCEMKNVLFSSCINLITQLPKPVLFNLFSLKHFPGYPLTKKAIDAGHITEEEVGDWPEQIKSTTENWKFKPRWKKRKKTKTKQLQRLK